MIFFLKMLHRTIADEITDFTQLSSLQIKTLPASHYFKKKKKIIKNTFESMSD